MELPLFDDLRRKNNEIGAKNFVTLQLDNEGVYDYASNQDTQFTLADYMEILKTEVDYYN